MKKILALDPAEREKECFHEGGGRYTGTIPCTGRYVCYMCGIDLKDPIHGDGEFGKPEPVERRKENGS